jgi:hypothetical protein
MEACWRDLNRLFKAPVSPVELAAAVRRRVTVCLVAGWSTPFSGGREQCGAHQWA